MEVITSQKNSVVRLFRSLSDKKGRRESGLFPVEGGNSVRDIPGDFPLKFVLATPERSGEAEEILRARGNGTELYLVSESVMSSLSDTVTPYGLAAAAVIPEREFALPAGKAVLLDGVSDPGNLGTILRTAAATGFGEVYLLGCTDAYAPKCVRASMGGIFRVRVTEVTPQRASELVRATNSVALDMNGAPLSCSRSDDILFVAGSEAHGVSREIALSAKEVRSLPMSGGVESLNVAVACAVAMYSTILS